MLSTADIDLKVKSLGTFQGLPESPIHGLNFRNVTFRLESDEESSGLAAVAQCNASAKEGFDIGKSSIRQLEVVSSHNCLRPSYRRCQ